MYGDMVMLLVGHQTCNLLAMGSSPDWAKLHSGLGLWASYLKLRASVTKQYNLVPAKGGDLFGWESNCGPGGR